MSFFSCKILTRTNIIGILPLLIVSILNLSRLASKALFPLADDYVHRNDLPATGKPAIGFFNE